MRLCWRFGPVVKLSRRTRTRHVLTSAVQQRRYASDNSDSAFNEVDLGSCHNFLPRYKPLTQPNIGAKNVAVIGGGITGLATAYNLTKELPNAKITLFDAFEQLGGWLDSETIPVDGGHVLFEWGPRTLRTDLNVGSGRFTAELIAQLDIAEEIIPTPNDSPAARNRYIYYPDHLVRIPGPPVNTNFLTNWFNNVTTVLQEPLFRGLLRGVFSEITVDKRSNVMQDESVGDFVTRRFGQPIADNIVSAVLHGIYAGDLYKLSARTLFPSLWNLEQSSENGVSGAFFTSAWENEQLIPIEDIEFILQSAAISSARHDQMENVRRKLFGTSVFTFKKGVRQLAAAMERVLRTNKNVSIKQAKAKIAFDTSTKQFGITDADTAKSKENVKAEAETSLYDYVVATISPEQLGLALKEADPSDRTQHTDLLSNLLPDPSKQIPTTVDVMVVNLFFRNPNVIPVNGFGYLIPRSVPLDQNPERALGVIFGSETSGGSTAPFSYPTRSPTTQDTTPGTKVTVMLGGHWWSSWPRSSLPDQQSAIHMSLSLLERHLGITETPIIAKAKMQWNAIPQYHVGHHDRMGRLHDQLLRAFGGKLKVAGSAYHGVGVNDCVKVARKACLDIREMRDTATGLEGFTSLAAAADASRHRFAVFKKRADNMWAMTAKTQ